MPAKTTKNGFTPSIGAAVERCLINGEFGKLGSVKDMAAIKRKLDSLDESGFFAFERVETKVDELVETIKREEVRPMMARMGYSEIDPVFLSWTLPETFLPAFMIFSIQEEGFSISVNEVGDDVKEMDETSYTITPDLPEKLEKQFEKVIVHLANVSSKERDGDEVIIEGEFDGVLPQSTRKKIEKARRGNLIDSIFIVCEANEWNLENVSTSSSGDPMVVGWNEETQALYLIDVFDVVPLNEYLKPKKKS